MPWRHSVRLASCVLATRGLAGQLGWASPIPSMKEGLICSYGRVGPYHSQNMSFVVRQLISLVGSTTFKHGERC